jgi:hypothetical protein
MSATPDTNDESRSGIASGAAHLAHEAADSVMHAASTGASSVKRQVTEVLDKQVASGADVISRVASSTRRTADDLEREVPQLAGVIRSVADTVDTYADDLKDKSMEDIVRSASDFTRRQPAAVFGFAAITGFLLFRALKSASEHSRMSDMGDRDDMGYARRSPGSMREPGESMRGTGESMRGTGVNMGETGDHFS